MEDHPHPTLLPVADKTPAAAPPMRKLWLPAIGGGAAVALLIALLAGLLITHASSRPTTATATRPVTAASPTVVPATAPAATATPSGPQWHPLASYAQTNG